MPLLMCASHALAQPYTQITAGENHTCALLDSGGVHCWGDNFRQQLGNWSATIGNQSAAPVPVPNLNAVAQIAAGREHNCAALRDGTVRCWGYNFRGQLGDGTTATNATPVTVTGISNAVAVTGGGDHSCALISGGTIKCWGYNGDGELGSGSTAFTSLIPLDVVGISDATAISAGMLHTCALLATNRVRCWGYNNFGALGDGTFTSRNTPVEISTFVSSSIEAGWNHTCSTYVGAVYCWGANNFGMLGDTTTTARNTPVQVQGVNAATGINSAARIATGNESSCAVMSNGGLRCWGMNEYGQGDHGHGGVYQTTAQYVAAPGCALDIDGDSVAQLTTDGALLTRALKGLGGTAVSNGTTGPGIRTTWALMRSHLERNCGVVGLAP